MKLMKLNEDVMFPEMTCTAEVREKVRSIVIEMLNENLDNLAFVMSVKVSGYNPEWCNQEAPNNEFDLSIQSCADAICKQLFYNCSSMNEEVENLEEDKLVEGPIKDLFRKAANFVDKDADRVKQRNLKAAGEADAKAERNALKVIARDVAPEYRDCRFYFNGKGKPISWDDWKDKYATLTPSDADYEGVYNAIVTTPTNKIIRRGGEYLEKKGIYLKPGITDKIPDMYKYHGTKEVELSDDSDDGEELDFDPGIPLPGEEAPEEKQPEEKQADKSKQGKEVSPSDYVEYNGKKISINKLIHIAKKAKYLESFDESNLVEGYDYIYGEDILSGEIGNMPDEDLDKDIKNLKQVARLLRVDINDLVCYVDPDFENDPVYLDGISASTKGNLAIYDVNGVKVVTEIVQGNLWLYFDSETSGNQYLDYIKENIDW